MLVPADGTAPVVAASAQPSLLPEQQMKKLFLQWMKEQESDSSSSGDEAASTEIETVIQRLQAKLDEQRGKKQVTFT